MSFERRVAIIKAVSIQHYLKFFAKRSCAMVAGLAADVSDCGIHCRNTDAECAVARCHSNERIFGNVPWIHLEELPLRSWIAFATDKVGGSESNTCT